MGFSTVSSGTAGCCVCEAREVVQLEVGGFENKDLYKITPLFDIEVVDLDKICEAEGVKKPYMPEDHTPFFHLFYGKKINGLRYPSVKDQSKYNIIFFPDWFKEYRSAFKKEKQ